MRSSLRRYGWAVRQVAAANVRRLQTPLKVNFALTYWCQYRCKTCNIWQRKPQNELSTSEVLRFFDRNRDIAWLDLTGGEIFLRKDVDDILQAAAALPRLVLLHFPTNGFLTQQIVRTCERLATTRATKIVVTVSIDGDESLNDDVRGIKGGFRRQIETFNALRSIPGIEPVFGMTLSGFNVGTFEQTFRACQRECPGLTIDQFHLNVAQLSNHYYGNADETNVVPDAKAAIRELHVYTAMRRPPRTVADWVESVYLRHLEQFLQTRAMPMRCHSLRSSCFVDPWGTVFPCITYSRPIGSLRDTDMDLAPIWSGTAASTIQQEIWDGNCPQCWTACEAYQSVMGNALRIGDSMPPSRSTDRRLPVLSGAASADASPERGASNAAI